MKILVLTDSLGLPRDQPESVFYEQTWPYFLSQGKYTVLQSSIGGATSDDMLKQMSYLRQYKPDIVILHVGIVDCAPRALTQLERMIFSSNKIVRRIVFTILPHIARPLRKMRNISYVSKKKFRVNLNRLISLSPQSCYYAIGIVPISDVYELQVPKMTKRAQEYNRILQEIFEKNFINIDKMPIDHIMSDFHHLNEKGHLYIYKEIQKRLNMLVV